MEEDEGSFPGNLCKMCTCTSVISTQQENTRRRFEQLATTKPITYTLTEVLGATFAAAASVLVQAKPVGLTKC